VTISVIIPTYNEAGCIAQALAAAAALPGDWEVLVVDGGSEDDTVRIARAAGARVVQGPRGRGEQMNHGAALARGGILLFLHADTRLPPDAFGLITAACGTGGRIGGCFRLRFDRDRGPLRLMGAVTRLPFRLLHYGDAAFFARAEVFRALGGYRPYPIMEDIDFWLRMRKAGPVEVLPACVVTSARRFVRRGVVRQELVNIALVLLFLAGVSPLRLKRLYDEVR
jgi:rSAM/selenodomain-associated transferase 2